MSTNTTPLYTPESVDEALLILDNATASASTMTDVELLLAIDMAAQKLRGVQMSPEDAERLELAKKHPIELPWMQGSTESIKLCALCDDQDCKDAGCCQKEFFMSSDYEPLRQEHPAVSCAGCGKCEEGGKGK